MNNTFSPKRTAQLMRFYFRTEWKTLLLVYAVTVALMTLFAANSIRYTWHGHTMFEAFCNLYAMQVRTVEAISYVGITILFFVGCSLLFYPWYSKAKATQLIQLPATNAEKFVSRFIYVLFWVVALWACAFLLADVLQFVIIKLFPLDLHFTHYYTVEGKDAAGQPIENFIYQSDWLTPHLSKVYHDLCNPVKHYGMTFLMISFIASLMLPSGIVFRWWGWAVGLLAWFVIMYILKEIDIDFKRTVLIHKHAAIFVVWICVNIALAYLAFCRMRVVQFKLFNL